MLLGRIYRGRSQVGVNRHAVVEDLQGKVAGRGRSIRILLTRIYKGRLQVRINRHAVGVALHGSVTGRGQ